jgi:guanylate kinase
VFLAPPSWEELVRRQVGRGTEDEAERTRRLETAREELAAESEFDVTVVNRRIHAAGEELVELMRSGTS